MDETTGGRWRSLVSVVVTNLIPLGGVLALGWDVAALLVLYWAELGVVFVWTAVKALFAARASHNLSLTWKLPLDGLLEKRGGVSMWSLPPMYPRNVPVALTLLALMGLVWLPTGVSLLAVGAGDVFADQGTTVTVAVAAGATFVSRGVAVWADYLRTGQYRAASAQSVVPEKYVVGLWALMLSAWLVADAETADAAGIGGGIALVAVVLVKLAAEVYEWAADADSASSVGARIFGTADESDDADQMPELPGEDPVFRTATNPRAVRFAGLLPGFLLTATNGAVFVLLVGCFIAAFFSGSLWVTAAAVGIVAVLATGTVAATCLQAGAVEYRVYEDALVAYDRRLRTPQWRVAYGELRGVSVSREPLRSRLFGTNTVKLDRGDGALRLRYLPDAERLADELDSRVW